MVGWLTVRRTVVCQIPGVLALLLVYLALLLCYLTLLLGLFGTSDPLNLAHLIPNLALQRPLGRAFLAWKHRVIAGRFHFLRSTHASRVGARASAGHRDGGTGFAV